MIKHDPRRGEKGIMVEKKRKGLVKKHVRMTHGHGQECGGGLWEVGLAGEGKGGKMGQL